MGYFRIFEKQKQFFVYCVLLLQFFQYRPTIALSNTSDDKYDFLHVINDNDKNKPMAHYTKNNYVADLIRNKHLREAVVHVYYTTTIKSRAQVPEEFNEFFEKFRFFFNVPENEKITSVGSGFIIDKKKGIIVTNEHVIRALKDNEEATVNIKFHDGYEVKAKIFAYDKRSDIALLKLFKKDMKNRTLHELKFGNSDLTDIGEYVVNISNPFGLEGTVSLGVISAKSRNIPASEEKAGELNYYIQTDAAVNQGSSGSPLIDMDGKVIGVINSLASPTGSNIGIGFAIPSNIAKSIIRQLIENGEVIRGWLGVTVQNITEEMAQSINFNKSEHGGVIVSSILENSPAYKAGIKPGDIIIKYDGKTITDCDQLRKETANTAINSKIAVKIIRSGDKIVNKEIILEKRPDDNEPKLKDREINEEKSVEILPGVYAIEESCDKATKIKIVNINKKSPYRYKLQSGDIIRMIYQKNINSLKDLQEEIKSAKKNKSPMNWLIERNGISVYIPILVSDY